MAGANSHQDAADEAESDLERFRDASWRNAEEYHGKADLAFLRAQEIFDDDVAELEGDEVDEALQVRGPAGSISEKRVSRPGETFTQSACSLLVCQTRHAVWIAFFWSCAPICRSSTVLTALPLLRRHLQTAMQCARRRKACICLWVLSSFMPNAGASMRMQHGQTGCCVGPHVCFLIEGSIQEGLPQGELHTEHNMSALGNVAEGISRPYTHQYHALRGTRAQLRGDAAREDVAKEMPLTDAMTRLRQGLISGSEFTHAMLCRSADDMAAVRCVA